MACTLGARRRNADQRLPINTGRSAALALLLAVALLLCHGVYGWHHQAHQTPTGTTPRQHAPEHSSHEGPANDIRGGDAQGQEGDCSNCVEFTAVLLVLYLVALLAARGAVCPRTSVFAVRRFAFWPVPGVSHPARGPALPALQVFRL